MSLLTQMMQECQLYHQKTSRNEIGGIVYDWVPGVNFNAAIEQASTQEQMLAEQQGLHEIYTVVTERGMFLDYHNVFVRTSDNAIFRVISKTQDAHPMSTVKIAKVQAERLEAMPNVSNS